MSKNKLLFIIPIILISISVIALLILYPKKENDNSNNLKNLNIDDIVLLKDEIEVYENIKLSEIVEVKDGKIIDDYMLDTSKIGQYEIKFKYRNDEEKTGEVTVNVVDTIPPYIGLKDHYTHIIDTNFTFDKDVLCADNYDRNITCEIIGEYDITKLGETNLTVVAEDNSGNITKKDFVLKVIEKPKKDSQERIKIEDIIDDNAKIMIDVSKWQQDIDWKKVKDSGVRYAMLRLGTQKALDKESLIDEFFDKNIKEAQNNGIKVGVYYFSYANDIDDAKEQAEIL